MRRVGIGITVVLLAGAWSLLDGAGMIGAVADEGPRKVDLLDDCDPSDAAWAAVGGCALREGEVTFAEFLAFRLSPLAGSIIGHLSWRNDPGYLTIEAGDTLRVRNRGGREHTFTEVAAFGAGVVPPLNFGLKPAPACANLTELPPGTRVEVEGLSVGDHRFQCCFHPWMRTHVKVEPED